MAAYYQAPRRQNNASDPLTYEHLQQYDNELSLDLAESSAYVFPNPSSSVPPSPSHFSELSERTEFSSSFSGLGSRLGSPLEDDDDDYLSSHSPRVLIPRNRAPVSAAARSPSSSENPNDGSSSSWWDLEFPLAPTLEDGDGDGPSSLSNPHVDLYFPGLPAAHRGREGRRRRSVVMLRGGGGIRGVERRRSRRRGDDSMTSSVISQVFAPKLASPHHPSSMVSLRTTTPTTPFCWREEQDRGQREAEASRSGPPRMTLPFLSVLSSLLSIDDDTTDLITSSTSTILFPGRKSVLLDDDYPRDILAGCIWDDDVDAGDVHGLTKLFEVAGGEDKPRMIRGGMRTLDSVMAVGPVPSLRLGFSPLSGLWHFVAGIVTKWK